MVLYRVDKILFVELLGGIGDILIALKAIHALARSRTSEITVLTFAPGGELLESDPEITYVVYADRGLSRSAVAELLSRQTFDLIVSDTNYDGIDTVIQNSSGSRVVTNLWRQPPANQLVGDRFLEILLKENLITAEAMSAASNLHLTLAEQRHAQETFANLRRPLVFLCPDAGMQIKRWSLANFITLGKNLQQRWNASIVVPVSSDLEQATDVVQGIGRGAQILPRGELRDLAAAIACADLVVAADTGSARIAAALDVPTITLFGPSWYGRYGQPALHINLQAYPECSERNISNFTEQRCWYDGVCPLDLGWQTCMEDIAPAEVLAAAELLLEGRR